MEIGMVGLGKMGANMTTRLLQGGHSVVAFDRNAPNVEAAVDQGAQGVESLGEMASALTTPRTAWVMVPAGEPTEGVITDLAASFEQGDTLIDGGNSNYKDTLRRAEALRARGVFMVDVGTSGGIWGLTGGYSMMVGGEKDPVERLRPVLETLAPGPDKGWGHVGPSGSGHFVKMIHNGIEYGLMQAYAEGFEILRKKEQFDLDLHQVAEIWRFGSVVRSWLLDLTAAALEEDASLSELEGWVADSGEGRWTVADAIDLDVPAPVITLSLLMRLVSRQDESYAAKLLAAMRAQFGGHAVKRAGEE
ncbi:MAG: decarboxylating 6-phosphogluconate dehydrogenase [Chloroflexi bacterium]|nr:decarboxylating 6-phosphogluconate dehydrogenase [Chloroflexota bacterium]